MKTRNTITNLIALIMTAAVLCGGALLTPINAQTGDGSVRFVSYASVGLIPGQMIRLSVANTEESAGTLTYRLSFYLAHGTNASTSVPLYKSEWIKVPSKEFRVSDVLREALPTEGEPETGRAQLIVKVNIIAPAGSKPEHFPGSLEIIEDEPQSRGITYKNGSEYLTKVVYQVPTDDSSWMPSEIKAPIGIIPGERLRYSFFYPTQEGDQPVRVQAYVYDSYGNLLKQTDPVVLRPGDFHALDINRDDLRVPGDALTERLEVRPSIQVVFLDGSVRHVKLSVSMEVVNNRSGSSSSGGDYYTGTVTVSGDGF